MSSDDKGLIGGIVGAAIGYFIPAIGVQRGFAFGSIVGGLLTTQDLGQGSTRASDLTVTTARIGTTIKRAWGNYRLSGNIIWATPIEERAITVSESFGKGGSQDVEYTVYKYYSDLAIGICEGEIGGVVRVWADSVLIYGTPRSGTNPRLWTCPEYSYFESIDFYNGTADQEPNWLIQSHHANAPAFRNTAYMVIGGLNLEFFGNRIPNITVEIASVVDYTDPSANADGYDFAYHTSPLYLPLWGGFFAPFTAEFHGYKKNKTIGFDMGSSPYLDVYYEACTLDPTSQTHTFNIGRREISNDTNGIDNDPPYYELGWGQGYIACWKQRNKKIPVDNRTHDDPLGFGKSAGQQTIGSDQAGMKAMTDSLWWRSSWPTQDENGGYTITPITLDMNMPNGFYWWITSSDYEYDYNGTDNNIGLYAISDVLKVRYHEYTDAVGCIWTKLRHLSTDPLHYTSYHFIDEYGNVLDKIATVYDDLYCSNADIMFEDSLGYTWKQAIINKHGAPTILEDMQFRVGIHFHSSVDFASTDFENNWVNSYYNGYLEYIGNPVVKPHPLVSGLSIKQTKKIDRFVHDPYLMATSSDWRTKMYWSSQDYGQTMFRIVHDEVIYELDPDLQIDVPSNPPTNIYTSTFGLHIFPTGYTSAAPCFPIFTTDTHFIIFGPLINIINRNNLNDVRCFYYWSHYAQRWESTNTGVGFHANVCGDVIYYMKNLNYPYSSEQLEVVCIDLNFASASDSTANSGLDVIVGDLLEDSGLEPNDYDVSALSGILVKGYAITKQMNTRKAISQLQLIYKFDLIESEFKIKAKIRDDIPDLTVYENDTTQLDLSTTVNTHFPNKISMTYMDRDIDFRPSSQLARRDEGNSRNNINYEIGIVLTPDEAKEVVHYALYTSWANALKVSFIIPFTDQIEVSDTVNVAYEGKVYVIRLLNISFNADYTLSCEGVSEHIQTYDQAGIVADPSNIGYIQPTALNRALLEVRQFNSTLLKNKYVNLDGHYIGVTAVKGDMGNAIINISKDNGIVYQPFTNVVADTIVIGITYNKLQDGPTTVWDLTNYVDLIVQGKNIPTSASTEDVLNGANYIRVGSEIIQYCDVNLTTISAQGLEVYRLSKLLRGRRGTEWATVSHYSIEEVTSLDDSIVFYSSEINKGLTTKVVNQSQSLDTADEHTIVPNGENRRPFSVTRLKLTTDASYNDTLSWSRRDRYVNGYLQSLPLSEAIEEYQVVGWNYSQYQTFKTITENLDGSDAYYTYNPPDPIINVTTTNTNITITSAEKIAAGLGFAAFPMVYHVMQKGEYLDSYSDPIEIVSQTLNYDYYNNIINHPDIAHFFRFNEEYDPNQHFVCEIEQTEELYTSPTTNTYKTLTFQQQSDNYGVYLGNGAYATSLSGFTNNYMSFTISLAFLHQSNTSLYLINQGQSLANTYSFHYNWSLNSTQQNEITFLGASYTIPTSILNTWLHVTARYNHLTYETSLFVNGQLVNSLIPTTNPISLQGSRIRLGTYIYQYASRYTPYTVDELRMYTGLLTDAEILQNYIECLTSGV